jgi:DNA-binding Xre family transcriptional regulator
MKEYEFRVKELAEENGITSSYQLKAFAELNKKTAEALWNETATGMRLITVERLCFAFGVKPGELYREKMKEKKSPVK